MSRMLTLGRFEERGLGASGAIGLVSDLGESARKTVEGLREWSEARGMSVAMDVEQGVDVVLAEEAAETLVSTW